MEHSRQETANLPALTEAEFISKYLYIRTKEAEIIPFVPTEIQEKVRAEETLRNVKLKPRQVGMSTWELAKRFARLNTRRNWTVVSIAHRADVTEQLFQTIHFFYRNLPESVKPKTQYSNRRELYFPEYNNRYLVFTAGGNEGMGQGLTVNDFHGSEVAYWPDPETILGGIFESVPKNAYIDLESTANGAGTWWQNFYNEAKLGVNGYKAFFFPWWQQSEYCLTASEASAAGIDPTKPNENSHEAAKEAWLIETYGLNLDQIAWRRWKKSTLKGLFDQTYPEDDAACFLNSGNSYFDKEDLDRASMIGVKAPFREENNGRLRVWAEPASGRRYLIGADVAEGVKGGDFSAAYVVNVLTGECVAALHGLFSPHTYAVELARLGHYYNRALIAVERNNHGHAVLTSLIYELSYSQIYQHKEYNAKGEQEGKPGFPTNTATRPMMLATLKQSLIDAPDWMHDVNFFSECRTFVESDSGKFEAERNCKDDRVMSAAIARHVWRNYRQPAPMTSAGGLPPILGGKGI